MEQIIYKNVLFASFVVMYAYALFSFCTLSPEGKEYDGYRVSRKIFGVTMAMWATYLIIHWFFNFRLNDIHLATTLSLSCYFTGVMLLEMTFSSLISGRDYPVRKRIKEIVITALCVNAALFSNYLFASTPVQDIVLVIMAILFTVEVVLLVLKFLRVYRNALKRADNYYSDNIDIFIRWMPNSIYLAIAFGFAGSILSFASNFAVSVYMFGGLLLFTYIFISYQNYMINITKMKDLLLTDDDNQEPPIVRSKTDSEIEPEVLTSYTPVDNINEDDMNEESKEMKRIAKRLNSWLKRRGFIKKGVTIEELAVKFDTNRTYLSSFINSTYELSFREWIAMHRIEYAKELLLADEEMSSKKIAEKVGYSPNAFTTIFTKSEKVSPMQWRSANRGK